MARIVCVGEGMLELSRRGDDWQLGYGGDTLNTAIHLVRLGHDVAYLTALGADPFSQEMKAKWTAEGLDTSLVLTHPTRHAGLYAIDTDAAGERSFTYWRDTSAAREMFALEGSEAASAEASEADLLYFSLITLAILPPEGRDHLLALTERARKVAFDGNYRPRLWASQEEALATRNAAIAVADIGLPTLEDETALSNANDACEVAADWHRLGCRETLVKLGAEGALLPDGNVIEPERVLSPIDTSGAGDAFNAGYLSARLNGLSIDESARAGHALAGWTIMRPGAIPPAGS
ncbi:sugar kinase [Novosphingobium sp. G106]|uniref:sugar kinase n=1 Tax=Novosphingobium sp. G106 TaxID=2849500 RepID=UPI001C2DC484|nr:sugar kinase [Novosphingobium sp. G106]MBV1686714.1 sugar kinase [Novosphingobium sp. G106]